MVFNSIEGMGMAAAAIIHFKCAHCDALYQVVKAKAGPETVDSEMNCRICGRPLAGRDGEFVLKYMLLRKAGRRQGQRKQAATVGRLPVAPR